MQRFQPNRISAGAAGSSAAKELDANGEIYFAKRRQRDDEAREQYLKRERRAARTIDDIYMLDILRGEMKQGDARLQRNIPE